MKKLSHLPIGLPRPRLSLRPLFLTPLLAFLLPLTAKGDAVVVFNEVMYHPATNETALEWVELHNQLAVDVDISDWSLSGGINYTFPSNSIIRGRGYAVVAISPSTLSAATGLANIYGPFTGRLGNDGDTIRLRNNSGRVLDELNYGVDDDWPVGPDGFGVSLTKRDRDSASDSAGNWTVSDEQGGTPGAQNFQSSTFLAPPGLVSYWNLNEAGSTALDSAGQNVGVLGAGVTRTPGGGIGGAASFNETSAAFINAGAGVNNSFAVTNGLSIEMVLQTTWNGNGSATLFRKAPARPTNYVGAIQASSPLAYWRLNDASTTIQDSGPNARNGTATAGVLLNQPSLIVTDPGNNSIRVGGADRVVIPGFEKIGAAGYTVEFWVKPTTLPTLCCQSLVGDGEAGGDYFMMNYILGPQQGLVGAVRPHFGPGNSPVSLDSTMGLQVGQTYHIVTTWDTSKTTENGIIYINGVAQRVGTTTVNVPAAGTTGANKVYIGIDDRGTTDGVNNIDEVSLYNRPLSASEVAAHYLAGAVTQASFDQNQGNAILLGFQNDGNNAQANPPVPAGPVLSFGLVVNGTYSELDMPLDGQSGRPSLAGLQNGALHHFAATYNPQTGLKAIFLDGVMVYSTTLSGALNANNAANAIIGNSEANGSAPLSGALDEVAYWGKALTATEISTHSIAVQAGRNYFAPLPTVAPVSMAFNEVSSPTNSPFFVELVNTGTDPIALAGLSLRHDGAGATTHTYNFPAGNLPAGGLIAVTSAQLGFTPADGDKFALVQNATGRVIDGAVVKNRGRARFDSVTGAWAIPSQPTPGAANAGTFHNEIVINEIMYSHMVLPPATPNGLPRSSPEEWVELYNRSAGVVNLTGWELGGGISYHFSDGQTLGPGAYLVVASDTATLRTNYPEIAIVGDFSGGLSGRSDRIVLRDPTGNVADEVRYFDGGRWPEYADGLGSSLELRDPNSDNSKAESWAASDETGKSAWQSFSYRMIASIPAGSGQPAQPWQDFILGLQSAGECLIDDISVIETPGTTPVQIITNGDFSSGTTGWRLLGTHFGSRVEPEPGNPGNNVLHLVATGAQEHMHNHIERTLNAGRTITSGREYEISYRARWLAGNNLLNTRLYFNRSARTIALPVPARNGTPGAQNSRFVANVGPTFSNFAHSRVVPGPGEPVTVSVRAEDPNNVASAEVFWSVNSGAWSSAAMTPAGGGRYTGSIPGQGVGAVVQFYVRATDGLGASATYPARGPGSGALYKVEDGLAVLSLAHNVRLILTSSNIDFMHGTAQGVNQTNVMSNDLIPCTVIYDESRAYYDCQVHLRGSQRGRYSNVRTGFHIEFPPDDLFRGTHPVMLIDRSGAGDDAPNRQEEIILKHMLNRAGGIPGTYSEICRILAPRTAHTGAAQFFPRHEDVFLETAFENGGDGEMFEMELIYFPTTATATGFKLPQPDNVVGTDITDLGPDKEVYRYNFMLKNHRDIDDYTRFIALGRAWSQAAGSAALESQSAQLMDIDQWMRAYALVSLCAVGDMYSFGNNHNFFTYSRPSDRKFVYFPWDMDFTFRRGSGGALVGDQNVAKVVNLPGNLRRMYAHMLDIIDRSFNTNYMAYWVDHYDNFGPADIYASAQNYSGHLTTIGARITFVNNTINGAGGNAAFTVAGPTSISTNGSLITLSGTAPVRVTSIKVNGREYALTWTSISAWSVRIPVSEGLTNLNVQAYNLGGTLVTNRSIAFNYTGPALPNPAGIVVINEIMYNPAAPETGYIELFNTSSSVNFDLSGWRINGIDFTFPPGSVITNRQYMVLAANSAAYVANLGTGVPTPYAQFSGNLQNDGETLTLLRPNPAGGADLEVDKVRYESLPPWPTIANGNGPSLQLIDATQDNSRVANWAAGGVWSKIVRIGSIGSATNFLLWVETPGTAYIDDISLVGPAGINILANGDFETGTAAPFVLGTNFANSTVVSGISHSGTRSLLLNPGVPVAGASLPAAIQQFPLSIETNAIYTLTFYILYNTNSVRVAARTLPGAGLGVNGTTQPLVATPGTTNTFADTHAPFPALWLNEAQPVNVTGITDQQGERDPWIELYNAGPIPITLDGYYLASGYANKTQWAFPPGASIAAGAFKVVFCDNEPGETTAGEWHTNFRLTPNTGSVALTWTPPGGSPEVLDYLNYIEIPNGRSYGAYPDGQPFNRQEFYKVTPSAPNNNTPAPIVASINEWMAANSGTLVNTNNNNRFDDWFELYNPGATAVSLDGYFLTDNLDNKFQFGIPNGFTIPPNGYLIVWADSNPSANSNLTQLHVNFRLDQAGEAIGLFSGDGTQIDAITFESQFTDRSQGRVPNGSGPQYFMATATPGAANTSWANRYPVLDPIAGTIAAVGQPITVDANASDPDGDALTFSLSTAPPTATVDPVTGIFSWTPPAPSTNTIELVVTDSGVPALSARRTFVITAKVGLLIQSGSTQVQNGNVSFSVGTTAGKTYRVEYKNALTETSWQTLGGDRVATGSTLTITDSISGSTQRFYRVTELP